MDNGCHQIKELILFLHVIDNVKEESKHLKKKTITQPQENTGQRINIVLSSDDNYSCFREKERFAARLKAIWTAPDAKTARKWKDDFIHDFGKDFKKACACLEKGFEDSIQYYAFERIDYKKISSTNTLERLNKEIRRRTKVVGIFPSVGSYIRLVTSYLLEYVEDHLTRISYIKAETLRQQKELLLKAAA